MKTLKTVAIMLALAIIVFLTCRNRGPRIIKVDPAYSKWVSGFTGGVISKADRIRIELATDYAPKGSAIIYGDSTLPDSAVLKRIFHFDPEIEGHAKWINSRVIEFTPSKHLQSSKLYTVRFKLGKLVDVPSKYENMEFQFRTWEQRLSVEPDGLKNYDQFHPQLLYLEGEVHTTDLFDSTLLHKMLTAHQGSRKLLMRFESVGSNHYRFYFDSVARTEEASSVKLEWDGTKIGAAEKGNAEFPVLALGNYSLENTKIIDNGDQKVELLFSDPIFPDQDFSSFIQIQNVSEKLQFSCDLNTVTIYLPTRIIGSRIITINKGLKNFSRAELLRTLETVVEFEKPLPAIRIPGAGNILPNSQGLRIPLETINLKAVDIRVIKIYENNIHQFLQVNNLDGEDGLSRVGKVVFEKKVDLDIPDSLSLLKWRRNVLDLGKLIKTDVGSIYRVSVRFRASYTGCGCEEEHQAGYNWNEGVDVEAEEEYLGDQDFAQDIDYDSRYYGYDDYDESETRGDPCSNDFYRGKALNRNILASDLGIIYKGDIQKNGYAFVSNLISAQPEPGTTIELYNYTKQLVASGITNEHGMADLKLTGRPYLLVAKKGAQRGYLKLSPNQSKSMSRFDTEGESVRSGLKGFIYGERGVWRPGDSIFLTFMLNQGEKELPPNHPYTLEFSDPAGQVIETRSSYLKKGNIDVIRLNTSGSAPTGNYRVLVKLGNLEVTKNIDIETVKPNRLKIQMQLPENGISASGTQKASMQVKWLHGAAAPRLPIQVELNLKPKKNPFSKFKSFVFESPLRKNFQYKVEAYNGNLDNLGKAEIPLQLNSLTHAPGVLDASYVSRVYENNGNINMDKSETIVHPFNKYFGLKVPENQGSSSLSSGGKKQFDIVCLDASQNLVPTGKVIVQIFKIDWKWWYEQESDENQANYLSRPATYLYYDTALQATSGKASFKFGIPGNQWGRFLVLVKGENGHECGTVITFDYPYWGRQNNMENDGATLLALSTDKNKYENGEKIRITFPSTAGSRALISVESSRKVVQKFWINTTEKETQCVITANKEMSPNAFVHVSLIQPHLQTVNDLPIRLYGVIPVEVHDPNTKLQPTITSAEEFRPLKTANITVAESQGNPMYYTLAIVDDGLLDLTHFKTPDPHKRFYAKEALGVKTWDIYDAVIGAHSGKMDRLLSIGGDGGYDEENGSKAQRFKPMVKFLGPFYLPAGGRAAHNILLPNYIGSVRIMVVAGNQNAYGQAEKTVTVKQPLMVLGTFPRVLGPDETVRIPITVFAMDKAIKNVKVMLQLKGEVQLTGNSSREINFNQPGEEMVYYEMKTNRALGIVKASISVTSGAHRSFEDVEIEIRSPNPMETRNTDVKLEPGQSLAIPASWFGVRGSNSLKLQFSSLPLYGIQNQLDYLIEYPHGCIEQTTSAVFAQLYLNRISNLSAGQQKSIQINIIAALKRYQSFQTSDGGFAYWPGENESSKWGSNYAGNFILEAEKAGYAVSKTMKENWLKYQQKQAKNWARSENTWWYSHGDQSYCLTQAYRLYLLALAGKPEMGAMNLLREEKDIGTVATWRLAAAYALSGKKDVSAKLVQGLSWNIPEYRELSYTYGSGLRDKAIILESLANMGMQSNSKPLFDHIANQLNQNRNMNTQEAAYTLMAICTWAKATEGAMNISVNSPKGGGQVLAGKKCMSIIEFNEKTLANNETVSVKNNGTTTVYLRQARRGSSLAESEIAEEKGISMSWSFLDDKGNVLNPESIPAGTDFVARVELTNTSSEFYKEMVLKEVMPGGWEITESRLFGGSDNPARYANLRDDRVYFYFDLEPKKSKEFRIRLHASYEGEYYLPSPYAEAMYDAGIHCRAKGKKIKVTKPSGLL